MILTCVVIFPIVGAYRLTGLHPAQVTWSQTLVLIEEQKVPDEYVKPVIATDLDSRLSSMKLANIAQAGRAFNRSLRSTTSWASGSRA